MTHFFNVTLIKNMLNFIFFNLSRTFLKILQQEQTIYRLKPPETLKKGNSETSYPVLKE